MGEEISGCPTPNLGPEDQSKRMAPTEGQLKETESAFTILSSRIQEKLSGPEAMSLRKFAKLVSISPGYLSKLLNYQQSFNYGVFKKVRAFLNLTKNEETILERYFFTSEKIDINDSNRLVYQATTLANIGSWQPVAILIYLNLNNGIIDEQIFENRFQISKEELSKALHTLKELSLIEESGQGNFNVNIHRLSFKRQGPEDNRIFSEMQKNFFEMSLASFSSQDESLSLATQLQSNFIAIDSEHQDYVLEEYRKFQRKINKLKSTNDNKKVFLMQFSISPLGIVQTSDSYDQNIQH